MTEQLSHGFFIVMSYGVTVAVVGGLIVWLVLTGRQRRSRIAALSVRHAGSDGA